jgi:hypothetical protein
MASEQELFVTLENKYRLPQGYLGRLYAIESSRGANLRSKNSDAKGPFQFKDSTAKAMDLKDPDDLAASADAAARLAVQNRAILQKNGVENPDGKMLYLAHQQGAGGALKLLNSGESPAGGAVGDKAVVANGGDKAGTSKGFVEQIFGKYEGADPESLRPFSALKTSEPLDQVAQAPVPEPDLEPNPSSLEEPAPVDRSSSKKTAYALNMLRNSAKAFEPQAPGPLLAIPRISYAEGGIVGALKNKPVMLTHYSNKPDLKVVDPAFYGTNDLGDDAKRTLTRKDGNPSRSYFYLGKPGDVLPEERVGKYAYTATSDKLYDLAKDPLKLYRGSSPAALNQLEKDIRANGYEGILGRNAAHPTAVLFEKKAVTRAPFDKLNASISASGMLARKAITYFGDFTNRIGGDWSKTASLIAKSTKPALSAKTAGKLAGHLANGNVEIVQAAISTHPEIGTAFSRMFHDRTGVM